MERKFPSSVEIYNCNRSKFVVGPGTSFPHIFNVQLSIIGKAWWTVWHDLTGRN